MILLLIILDAREYWAQKCRQTALFKDLRHPSRDAGQLVLLNSNDALQRGMTVHLLDPRPQQSSPGITLTHDEVPLTVRAAAAYLGVSMQTVYLWVERKQIPHLRVMGRNIRFFKSDLQPFRAAFKQEVEDGKT